MRTQIDNIPNSNNEFKVQFFSLKDGETSIVRFMIQTEDDFDVITLHNLTTGDNKYIRVDCIRDPRQPLTACPLCAANEKLETRAFIKLIQYVKNSDGSFTPKAKVWDRSVRSDVVTALKTYLNTYGDLTDVVCAITRTGATFNDTKYTIAPNLPHAELYPKDFSDFDGYDVIGTIVKEWTAEDMNNFLMTGAIPANKKAESSVNINNLPPAYSTTTVAASVEDPGLPFNDSTITTSIPNTAVPPVYANPNPGPVPAYINEAPASNRPRRVYN